MHVLYIYDEDVGDPYKDIPPGTKFEDLPENWKCPVCGALKDMFYPLIPGKSKKELIAMMKERLKDKKS